MSSSKDTRAQADTDCVDGPIHVLLVHYDHANLNVTLWSEPLHLIRANYYIDPWNQGTCVMHVLSNPSFAFCNLMAGVRCGQGDRSTREEASDESDTQDVL